MFGLPFFTFSLLLLQSLQAANGAAIKPTKPISDAAATTSHLLSSDDYSASASMSQSANNRQPNYFWWGLGVQGDENKGRPTIDASILFNKAFTWGIPAHLIQFEHREKSPEFFNPDVFFAPSIATYNDANAPMPEGADTMFRAYNQALFDRQKVLIDQCTNDPTCDHIYITVDIWGTQGKMDWAKDGVILSFVGIIKVGGNNCNFPTSPSCQVSLLEDWTYRGFAEKEQEGLMVDIGTVHKTQDINQVLTAYSKKTKKALTLTDGTLAKIA